MLTIKSLLIIVLSLLLLPSFSLADTYVVTNLNDPGAGSMRQAITNSNLNPGPDEIVFEEGLEGTIVLNLGQFDISDDLTITGPGAIKIIVDADGKSRIFFIQDGDSEINIVVKISGFQFINGTEYYGGIIENHENLSVENCEFINSNSDTAAGGAIDNYKILTVNSCLFDNNSAFYGGAISNEGEGVNVKILDSEFRNNKAQYGAVIRNQGSIDVIANSTFTNNIAGDHGGVIQNDFCNVTCLGTIKEISNSTFGANESVVGGAIFNSDGLIENITNSTFSDNRAVTGSAIRNHGLINISFSTIANNLSLPLPPDSIFTMDRGGIVTEGNGVTRIRNTILKGNSPDNCYRFLDDFGGNYSDDFSCGLTGDGAEIILNPLADNGGPTETMDLRGVNPIDGATVNCDALDGNGNPTGIPIGVDQRYFPRPYGIRCDSGAVENMPGSVVLITKISSPSFIKAFEFVSSGFSSLVGCGITGDNGTFTLHDKDSIQCTVPVGEYKIREEVPDDYRLSIECFGKNPNLIIDNENDEIVFSVPEIDPSPDVICIFFNIKKGSVGGGCTLAGGSNNSSLPLFLLIPALILIRRVMRRYRIN